MLLLLRFFTFFYVFLKIQKNVTFYVFLLCFTRFLELWLAANDDLPSSPGLYPVIGCKLKQNANEGCNSCASFVRLVACFIVVVIALLTTPVSVWGDES